MSLLHNGCIGSSPTHPTVAITICTLDMFQQSHWVCPRFSIHAATKMLCFMHNLCYRRHLAEQMRTAFDIYLKIHCRINSRLDKFLGCDTENWRMLNSCPACQYKLVNEPTLDFSILCACDGNNSAKLVDPAVHSGEEHLDPHSGLSSIWLTESYIDQFKDEVQSAQACQARQPARQQPSDPDDSWIDEPDLNDSAEPPTICVDHWCNAAPESRKKMFAIFKKSGIFVTVCRHGFLLTICDMVRSGELMKYPIASVKKLMDCRNNIKCAFKKIIQRSSLADDAKHLNLQGVVPAFHGHAHNRLCQVEHHSKYKVGAGKEDFETCEWVFSESNALAAQIRNTTDFHRHQALDEHFSFADLDKFAALSLTIISTTNIFLTNFHASNAVIKPNFEDDLKDEYHVLQCLARKKEESTVEVDYVRALNEYDEAHKLNLRLNYSTKESGDIRRRHANATNKRDQKLEIVMHYKHQMALDSRWGPDHPERMKAQSRITNRLFHKAVDDVERLVVMRLLELTKLQMSGLGYKLRTQISKALKSRANAIRNALTQYNKYGALLSPPRPPLQWDQIVEYSFLAEFDLLWETDGEIQSKSWANPSYRHASTQYFEHQRANEEIHRLNVELRRLLTKMQDDAIDYPHAITQLQSSDPPLAAKLQRRWTQLQFVNARHIWRIQQIMQLPGYSGPKNPGSHDREEGDRDDVELGQQLEDVQAYIEGLDHHRVDLELAE
ncbi:hypothetical protein C8R48DRAFT_745440 [Suillus tomentosus]|nr:hypothetical protein C8R48DRAFT_745440 [Suillus tomentosus]